MNSATAAGPVQQVLGNVQRGELRVCCGYLWENRLEWRASSFFSVTTYVPDSVPGRVEVPQRLRYAVATLHTAYDVH